MNTSEDPVPRELLRRQEDQTIFGTIEKFAKFAAHYKAISILGVMLIGGVSAGAAWIGAQKGMPARVDRLEAKVDSGFEAVRIQVDTLAKQVKDVTQGRDLVAEQLDLLLRLQCPGVQQPQLVRPCRPYVR